MFGLILDVIGTFFHFTFHFTVTNFPCIKLLMPFNFRFLLGYARSMYGHSPA